MYPYNFGQKSPPHDLRSSYATAKKATACGHNTRQCLIQIPETKLPAQLLSPPSSMAIYGPVVNDSCFCYRTQHISEISTKQKCNPYRYICRLPCGLGVSYILFEILCG